MIRMVYFDAAGTLLRPWPSVGAVYAAACRPHGLSASDATVEAAFRQAWSRRRQQGDDGMTRAGRDLAAARAWWRGLVDEVLDAVGFTAARAACFEACYETFSRPSSWRVFGDVRPALVELRGRGIPVGVLSNWDTRLPALLDGLDLAAFFGPVVVSALEGVAKPRLEIFRVAARAAGVPPAQILHVGDDRLLDREAALRAGFRALLVRRDKAEPEPGVIRSLGEIPGWIARQGRSAGPC